MSGGPGVSARQAQAVLGELARLRTETRRGWGSPWFALICFGSVAVLAAAAMEALGSAGLVGAWVLAGGVAFGLTRRHFRRRARIAGVVGRGGSASRWSLTAFALCFIAAAVGSRADAREGAVVASIVVVLVSYLALGLWERRSDGPVAVALATVPAFVLVGLSGAPWLVELAFGAGLIAAGGVLRSRAKPR